MKISVEFRGKVFNNSTPRPGKLYHHVTLGAVTVSSVHTQYVTVLDRLGCFHKVKQEVLSSYESGII